MRDKFKRDRGSGPPPMPEMPRSEVPKGIRDVQVRALKVIDMHNYRGRRHARHLIGELFMLDPETAERMIGAGKVEAVT